MPDGIKFQWAEKSSYGLEYILKLYLTYQIDIIFYSQKLHYLHLGQPVGNTAKMRI